MVSAEYEVDSIILYCSFDRIRNGTINPGVVVSEGLGGDPPGVHLGVGLIFTLRLRRKDPY